MEKILDKIYSEKDLSTNIAIFVGSLSALIIYVGLEKDSYLGFTAFLSVFSLTKVISKVLIERYVERRQNSIGKKYYSELEKGVISAFTESGTSFITLSDLNEGKYEVDSVGLDSLVIRGAIEFVDNSMGTGPTGFCLKEDIYKMFLK